MLRKEYHHGVVGFNYLSLIYGIISLKKENTTLIINDNTVDLKSKWSGNIGHSEKTLLGSIGRNYDIDCLINIDNYLTQQNTVLYVNETMIEFSSSPFTNIREFARKFPGCFTLEFIENLNQMFAKEFDSLFFSFIDEFVAKLYDGNNQGIRDDLFSLNSRAILNDVYDSFLDFLHLDDLESKQLHYALQVMFQTVFSSGKNDLETKYLLTCLISPRFKVDMKALEDELILEYRKLGGDLRLCQVKDWGIDQHSLNYLLLDNVDGIVHIDITYFFGHSSELYPFETKKLGTRFLSIKLQSFLDHEFMHLFKNKRIVFSREDRMGSDFPYWEVQVDNNGLLTAVYSFADSLGTKASFYYHHAIEDLYNSLETMLPGLSRADWVARAKLEQGSDQWYEYKPKLKPKLHPSTGENLSVLFDSSSNKKLENMYQYGSNYSKSLGLFSYLLDVFPR